jgi:cytochrome P450
MIRFCCFISGTDTTTTALTCLLLILLHQPEVQKQMHAEIDHVIGCTREPTLSDRGSMPYTEACLLETLRYISHVPLAVPHATTCDTLVCGKRVPKDTTVSVTEKRKDLREFFSHVSALQHPAASLLCPHAICDFI